MSKPLLTLFLVMACISSVCAQTIVGRVTDNKGKALPYATISIKGSAKGTNTDANGRYSIAAPKEKQVILICSFIGYNSIEKDVSITTDTPTVNFVLSENTKTLNEIKIEGKSEAREVQEQPYVVNAIDAKLLKNNIADVNQVLQKIPGVQIRQQGGVGSGFNLFLNGYSGNQVKFFLDGVPMDNFGESLSLNNIPVNVAKRIEVYKGVVPVHLGADALGGAINLITDQSSYNYIDASYSYGSFNTHRSSINAAFTSKKGLTVRTNIFQNYSDNNYTVHNVRVPLSNGKFSEPFDAERFHDTYDSKTIKLDAGLVGKSYADNLLIGIILSESDKDIQTGSTMDKVFGKVKRTSSTVMPSIKYDKADLFTKGLNVSLYGSYNNGEIQNIDTTARTYYWDQSYKELNDTTAAELIKTLYTFKNHLKLLRAGISYNLGTQHRIDLNHVWSQYDRKGHDEVNPYNQAYAFPQTITKNILGLGYSYNFKEKLNANVFVKYFGLKGEYFRKVDSYDDPRYEKVDPTYDKLGYGAALSYHINKQWQLKASYELASRLPDGDEIFGDGIRIAANPELKPEESKNLNVGARFRTKLGIKHMLEAEGNFIYRNADGFIRNEIVGNQNVAVNLRSAKNSGAESQITYTYNDKLRITLNATYQNLVNNDKYEPDQPGKVSPLYEVRLPNIPYFYGNSSVSYQFDDLLKDQDHFSITYGLSYNHQYYLKWDVLGDPDSKNSIPEQWSHQLAFAYSLSNGKYNISGECNNITDSILYDNFRLEKPGRAFYLKLRYFLNKI